MALSKLQHRLSRKKRIRSRIRGTSARPRFTVFRSLKRITAQLIDDDTGRTVVSLDTMMLKAKPTVEGAAKLGKAIAEKAKEAKVNTVVFDRNGYQYHGRIKALADAAREAGLTF